jgi:hypothetical protein
MEKRSKRKRGRLTPSGNQGESLEQMLCISTCPVSKLRESRWEADEEEEQAEEKATVEEKEEEAKGQARIIGRVTGRMIPTMSSRLVKKLWVSRRRRRSERASGSESH